jgi:hypothetical protein
MSSRLIPSTNKQHRFPESVVLVFGKLLPLQSKVNFEEKKK